MRAALLAAATAGLPAAAIHLSVGQTPSCPTFSEVVEDMRRHNRSADAQAYGCGILAYCVDTSKVEVQNEAVAAGVLEAVVDAMRNFPDDKAVQSPCISAMGRPILFNRANGLRASALGGLNLSMKAYGRWMDDPEITQHGGDVGCFMDFCPENRQILRELGGVSLLVQNIKNNFHGKYGAWNYLPVKESLFGLSSGTWNNADVAYNEGMIPLAVQLMNEHTAESKISEETLQVVKAMFAHSNSYLVEFADLGLASTLAKVLRENPTDRGAVSLACSVSTLLMGSGDVGSIFTEYRTIPRNDTILASMVPSGLLEQVLATTMSDRTLHHKEHSGFNFDVDASYNAKADCYDALLAMSAGGDEHREAMLQSGLMDQLATELAAGSLDWRGTLGACALVSRLSLPEANSTAMSLASTVAGKCPHE